MDKTLQNITSSSSLSANETHDLLNTRKVKGDLRTIDDTDRARVKSRSRNIKRALKAIDEANTTKRDFGEAISVMFDALYSFTVLSPELVELIVAQPCIRRDSLRPYSKAFT